MRNYKCVLSKDFWMVSLSSVVCKGVLWNIYKLVVSTNMSFIHNVDISTLLQIGLSVFNLPLTVPNIWMFF